MKRIITILLTAMLLLSLCACSTGEGAASGSDLTQKQIERALAKMEAEESAQQ